MMHHWDGGWGGGMWLLMGFGMLLFWALVVAGLVWLIRSTRGGPTSADRHDVAVESAAGSPRRSALDILDERYARGEIGDEEYRTRRDTLGSR